MGFNVVPREWDSVITPGGANGQPSTLGVRLSSGPFSFPSAHRQFLSSRGSKIGPFMSDQHIRILTAQARHSQRQLDAHDAADEQPGPESFAAGESSRDVPGGREQVLRLLASDAAELRYADEL
jgi:hypothetical protein